MKDEDIDDSVVEIDEGLLDKEWLKQPKLFMRYAIQLAEVKLEFAEAKANLELVQAELEHRIREDPETYGIKKVTEGSIHSALVMQKRYKQAVSEMNLAKHRVDLTQAVVDALDHRKRALENLVTLHGQNYFSTPRVKGGVVDEQIKQQARSKGTKKR